MPSMDLNPEIVFSIIDRVHTFQGASLSPDEGTDPSERPQATGNSIYAELEAGIEDLEPDQQVSLVALMWMGRGDFDASQWDEAYRLAAQRWTDRTADYLTGTPLLADYLEEGLNQLGYER